MHFLAYFALQDIALQSIVVYRENHARSIYLTTVLNMGESQKHAMSECQDL